MLAPAGREAQGFSPILAVDDQLRDIIARNPHVAEFRRLLKLENI